MSYIYRHWIWTGSRLSVDECQVITLKITVANLITAGVSLSLSLSRRFPARTRSRTIHTDDAFTLILRIICVHIYIRTGALGRYERTHLYIGSEAAKGIFESGEKGYTAALVDYQGLINFIIMSDFNESESFD